MAESGRRATRVSHLIGVEFKRIEPKQFSVPLLNEVDNLVWANVEQGGWLNLSRTVLEAKNEVNKQT